jgi:hypothetical protein
MGVARLGKAGCFPYRQRASRTDFDLEPEDTPQSLVDRFYAANAPCLDEEACVKVKHVVTLLQGRPKLKPPHAFLNDAIKVIREKEMPLDVETLGMPDRRDA